MYKLKTCEEKFLWFTNIMDGLIEKCLPVRTAKRNSNDPPWLTDEFSKLIKLRQYHFQNGNKLSFNILRNKVNRTRKSLQKRFFSSKITRLSDGSAKEWWKDIEDIIGKNSQSNHLQGLANKTCHGNLTVLADNMNDAFVKVSSHIPPLNKCQQETNNEPIPEKFIISVEQTASALSRIKVNKAVGPDSIPNWILKDCSQILSSPICAIWNASLQEGYLPHIWKCADVCPLAKVSPPMDINKDLRPISLTLVLSKGIEWFSRNYLLEIFDDILDEFQFGSIRSMPSSG
jgi:hypothetical protein